MRSYFTNFATFIVAVLVLPFFSAIDSKGVVIRAPDSVIANSFGLIGGGVWGGNNYPFDRKTATYSPSMKRGGDGLTLDSGRPHGTKKQTIINYDNI
jgi:hypothetical protein